MNDDEYDEKSSQIRQLAQLPSDQLTDKLADAHERVATVAPNIAPHVHAVAMNAIKYLNSKLPFAGNELAMDPDRQPSPAEKSRWMKIHDTVNDPLSVLDHVKNGTLMPHHVEAVKAVYPDLHQEMVDKINEEVGLLKSNGKKVPYKTALHLSQLTGSPLDSTMTPQNMQAILHASMPEQPAQSSAKSGGPKKASGPELNQIDKTSSLLATSSQARQMGKRD